MTIFADVNFYTNEYLCGKEAVIDTASFPFYARKASEYINTVTYGRATDIEVIKLCCCELAEAIYKHENQKQLSSEKVGEYSVSYNLQSDTDYKSTRRRIVREWLADTGLLYCGVE